MELLLWLWLFDKRWLFGYKPNINLYIFVWLFPILMNVSVISFNFYFISFDKNIHQYAMFSKSLFCLLSLLSSIILIKNLISFEKIENNFFEKIKDMTYSEKIKKDDYWISRNSLISFNGCFLLIISLCQILWSIYYIKYGIKYSYYVTMALKQSAFLEIGFACFIGILLGISMFIKVSAFISSYICPNLLIFFSKLFNHDQLLKLDFDDIENPVQDVQIV